MKKSSDAAKDKYIGGREGHRTKLPRPKTKGAPITEAPPANPTPSEERAIAAAMDRTKARRERVSVKTRNKDGVLGICAVHSDHEGFCASLLNSFGTPSRAFSDEAIGRLGAIMRRKGSPLPTEGELNAALAAVDGLEPKDEIEAMLAI